MSQYTTPVPFHVIAPTRGWAALQLRDVWAYRELIAFLVWRDIKVRYRQTVLGGAWAVLQPLMTMAVFTLFFGKMAKLPSDGQPYALFTLVAVVPWTMCTSGVNQAAISVINNSNIMRKVYFPRLILPTSAVLSTLLDLCLNVIMLVGILLYFGYMPTLRWLAVPGLLLIAISTSMGVGFWLSALNIRYRDVRHVLPFLVQFWMFATPVAYSNALVSQKWQWLVALNPMSGVVNACRWALLNTNAAPGNQIVIAAAVATGMLLSGAFYFRQVEQNAVDII
jgi:lipopolysaccharide transport system permease protein